MSLIYLSLGSNLGNRKQHLDDAVKLISSRLAAPEMLSMVYESEPWGYSSKHRFCNCCLSLHTTIDPLHLLNLLLGIENELGRERAGSGYSDRVIDIDILLYDDLQLDLPGLKLPHPSMADRRFVLLPLTEIASDLIHPVSGLSISKMLENCSDTVMVAPLRQP
jgi:2-amino-4-hydroxy-6-hydroxymethyldihydropteridine diphosphokinase